MASDLHRCAAISPVLLLEIQETHRKRQDLLRAENALGNQIEAKYRRMTGLKREERAKRKGDPELAEQELAAAVESLIFEEARKLLHEERMPLERTLSKLSKELPVYGWALGVRGLGALALAQIVAEAGDLSKYPDDPKKSGPACLWKRMGLAVDEEGKPQRRVRGEGGKLQGFSPRRRAVMATAVIGLVNLNKGEYRAYYDAEKVKARAKLPDAPAAHIDARARRHLAKRLLRDLWCAWRDHSWYDIPPTAVPPDATDRAAD